MEAPYRPDVKGFMRMSAKEQNDDEQGAESGRWEGFPSGLPHHRTCGFEDGGSWQSLRTKQHSFSATMIAAQSSACRLQRSGTRPPMVVSACQVQPFPYCETVRCLRFRLVALGTRYESQAR